MKLVDEEPIIKIEIENQDRVDKALRDSLEFSRSKIQDWIEAGRVKIAGKNIDSSSKSVKPGDIVEIDISKENIDEKVKAEDGPLDTVYEDEYLLAVNKPSGLIVHPAPGINSNTLVNRLLWHYPELKQVGPPDRAGLVHRLDRGTSGVLLVARSDAVLKRLQDKFRMRSVKKKYSAILNGKLADKRVRVEVPIDRHPANPTLRVAAPEGKKAVTVFEKVAVDNKLTAVRAFPQTGRTHQIRVHGKYINHLLVGDRKYGGKRAARLMLHAEEITFSHPHSGEEVTFTVPLTGEVKKLWNSIVK